VADQAAALGSAPPISQVCRIPRKRQTQPEAGAPSPTGSRLAGLAPGTLQQAARRVAAAPAGGTAPQGAFHRPLGHL